MAEKQEVDFQAYARKVKDAMGNDAGEKEAGTREFGEKCTNYFYHKLQAAADTMKKNGYLIDEGLQFGEHTLAETMQMAGMTPEEIQKMKVEDKLKFAAFYAAGVEFANAKGKTTLPMYVHLPAENGKVQPQVLDDEGLVLDDMEKKGQLHSEVAVNFFEWLINLLGISTDRSRYNDQLKRSKELGSRISEHLSEVREKSFTMKGELLRLDKENTEHISKNIKLLDAGQEEADKWNKLFFGKNVPESWVCRDGSRLDPFSACIGIMNVENFGDLNCIIGKTPDEVKNDPAAMELIERSVTKYRDLANQYETEKKAHPKDVAAGTFRVSASLDKKLHDSLQLSPLAEDQMDHSMVPELQSMAYSAGMGRNMIPYYPFAMAQEQLEKVTHDPAYKSGYTTFAMRSDWNSLKEEIKLYHALKEGNREEVQKSLESVMQSTLTRKAAKEMLKEKIRANMIKGNMEKIGKGAVPDGDVAIIQNAVKEKIDSAGLDRMSPKKFAQAVDAVLSGRFAKKGRVKLLLGDNGNNIASIDVSLGGSAILESQKIGIRDVNKIQPKMDKIEEEPEAENQDENEMIL